MICVGLADLGVYAFSVNPETNQNQDTLPIHAYLSSLFASEMNLNTKNDEFKKNQKSFFEHMSQLVSNISSLLQTLFPDDPDFQQKFKLIIAKIANGYKEISNWWGAQQTRR